MLVSGCQFDLVVCVQCGCIFHLIALSVVSVTHFFKNRKIHQCRVTLQYGCHKQSTEKHVRGETEGLFTGRMCEVSGAGA